MANLWLDVEVGLHSLDAIMWWLQLWL